ncbi:MAG: hypothetical protein AB8B95_01125 [Pseudohongiellaceae bacterium]
MIEQLSYFSQITGIYAFMNTPWGWPIIESLHFVGLCLLFGTVGVFDLRLLGIASEVSYYELSRLIPFGVAGYFINVTTGIMFVSSAPDQYLYNPAFQTKLVLMLFAGINMLVFHRWFSQTVYETPLSSPLPSNAKVIGALSLLAWTAIIVCGRLITYYRPPYHWCIWC